MPSSQKPRVALFVDSANIELAAQDLGFDVNWERALEQFTRDGVSPDAYFYVALREGDGGQKEFLHAVAEKGFIVRTKPMKTFRDEQGREHHKGNLDIEIALDMVATADNWDVAYLFSGDSDFSRVVEVLQSRGKRVHVVAARDSLSEELLMIANKPVFYLEDLKENVAMSH